MSVSVAIVSTVRTTRSTLRMFAHYYLNTGVDRMFLFFDDPRDEALADVQGDSRITAIRCDDAHWAAANLSSRAPIEVRQCHNANIALQLAKAEGITWLIHVDSDELIVMPQSHIGSYLKEKADYDAVRFAALEAVPKARYVWHPFQEIHWFKSEKPYFRGAGTIAQALGCRKLFELGYIKGHSFGKMAARLSSSIVEMNTHGPIRRKGSPFHVAEAADAFTLHFDCCTFEEWKVKWGRRLDGTATAKDMRKERRQQFAEFERVFQSGLELALRSTYRRRYGISGIQLALLAALGFVRRVHLHDGCFIASSYVTPASVSSVDASPGAHQSKIAPRPERAPAA